jgi:hypothetical protein
VIIPATALSPRTAFRSAEKTANPLFYQNDYIDQIRKHFFKAQPYSSLGEFVEESSLLCLSDLE